MRRDKNISKGTIWCLENTDLEKAADHRTQIWKMLSVSLSLSTKWEKENLKELKTTIGT